MPNNLDLIPGYSGAGRGLLRGKAIPRHRNAKVVIVEVVKSFIFLLRGYLESFSRVCGLLLRLAGSLTEKVNIRIINQIRDWCVYWSFPSGSPAGAITGSFNDESESWKTRKAKRLWLVRIINQQSYIV